MYMVINNSGKKVQTTAIHKMYVFPVFDRYLLVFFPEYAFNQSVTDKYGPFKYPVLVNNGSSCYKDTMVHNNYSGRGYLRNRLLQRSKITPRIASLKIPLLI